MPHCDAVRDLLHPAEPWWNQPDDSIAVLSSGGMSAQVIFGGSTGLEAVSLPHAQKDANDSCRDPNVRDRDHPLPLLRHTESMHTEGGVAFRAGWG